MNLDYDIRRLNNEQRIEQRKIDEKHIEFFQEGLQIATEINSDTIDWVLELVDRLEEAGYDWQEAQNEITELKEYIEDWQVRPNLGKYFDEQY